MQLNCQCLVYLYIDQYKLAGKCLQICPISQLMNEAFLKVPSPHGYNTTGTNHLWSLPDQLQTEGGQTTRLGSREGVYSSGPCSVLRGGQLGTPLIPPWQPSRVTAVTLSLPPFSCHMTQHHELHSLGNQTKTCVWKGECSAWHTEHPAQMVELPTEFL